MKKSVVLKYMTCLILAISLVSCKDMLEEYNPSGTTAEAVYTTPSGYEALVAAAYSYQRYWYGKEDGLGLTEFGTDIWTAGSETYVATNPLALENRPLILYTNLSPVNQNVRRLWKQSYAAVNVCNAGIKIADDGTKGATFKPNAKRVAELYFLRAFYYWHIVETWGGVHFSTEPTTKAVTTANRTPEATFYAQIISDLEKAIAGLDLSKAEVGRANRTAAKAFLARVYLTKGYKSFGTNDDFVNARNLANEVIATPGYSLLANYKDLWDMTKQKNDEVIYSVNYSTDFTATSDVYDEKNNPYGYGLDILSTGGNPTANRGSNNGHAIFVPTYDRGYLELGSTLMVKRDIRNGWPFARVKPTKYLLDIFDGTKDERYKGSFQTVWKVNYNVTAPAGSKLIGKIPYRDTALVIDKNPPSSPNYYTYNAYDSYTATGTSVSTTGIGNQLFPGLIKHMDSTRFTTGSPSDLGNGNSQSAKDVFVIRLAEMYMISAEASFKLGNISDATTKLNDLRNRAELPGQSLDITDADVSLNFILDERAREFAGEYQRWFDLKRTGTLVSRVQAYNPDATGIASHHVYRPIPQLQIDVVTNKGEFFQNTGY